MPESMSTKDELLNWDIDRYLNPFVPHNRLYIFPKSISRWLGYRSAPAKEPATVLQWPITFLATVAGLCLVAAIGQYAPGIAQWQPPVIIASLGASAVLDFNTIKSPLAQPRNAVVGNTLAALMGVCAAKLFQLNPAFDNIQWVSGAVGCALASLVMSFTGTIHPPGGATAVLASTEPHAIAMGWMFIPIVLLDSVLMQIVALIFNNLFRQYPVYWWSGAKVGRQLREEKSEKHAEEGQAAKKEDGEKKDAPKRNDSNASRYVQPLWSRTIPLTDFFSQ
jgi:CBS-domain-containing membrane protein